MRLLRLPGNRGTEEAAQLLARALDLIAEDASQWAEVAGNLAHAVARRASGDPNENWAHARELLLRACAADPDANPRAWATNSTNLGLLLSERPGGADVDDLAAGIKYMRAGASRRSPDDDLIDWTYSQLNLGLLHRRRGHPGDDVAAVDLYREALDRLTPSVDPRLWAHLQLNLGELLAGTGSPGAADRALEAARAGLECHPAARGPGADGAPALADRAEHGRQRAGTGAARPSPRLARPGTAIRTVGRGPATARRGAGRSSSAPGSRMDRQQPWAANAAQLFTLARRLASDSSRAASGGPRTVP